MEPRKKKVLLGMSGGVDSSLSAALLLEQGYEVIGAFMKNWSPLACEADAGFEECDWRGERRDAMRVAGQLGIPFLTFDFEKEYRERVIEDLFAEYDAGRTPNPDILCNKHVKFDLFVKEADKLGCDFIATGHYARTETPSGPESPPWKGGEAPRILQGVDTNKDQTYFLWAIPPAVVPRVLFPVGHLTKPQVREEAKKRGIVTAEKKDSTGICFVGEVDLKKFLLTKLEKKPGNIVTPEGKVLGRHDGLAFFTVGQREGLNVAVGEPLYVAERRLETNELVVAPNGHPALFRSSVEGVKANWFRKPADGAKLSVRLRHQQVPFDCTVSLPLHKRETSGPEGVSVLVQFAEPQRGVAPGQSMVFYDGEEMVGGAIIA